MVLKEQVHRSHAQAEGNLEGSDPVYVFMRLSNVEDTHSAFFGQNLEFSTFCSGFCQNLLCGAVRDTVWCGVVLRVLYCGAAQGRCSAA